MARQLQGAQRDFSFGEIDIDLKRADEHPARKGGLRQMSNMRIHNSGALESRPGRSALFLANTSSRIEEITMSPGNIFKLAFGAGGLRVINSAGAQVAGFTNQNQTGGGLTPLPWAAITTGLIVYAQMGLAITITFPTMQPQVLAWDGVVTWTLLNYAEMITGTQKRTPFYRISPQGVTLLPDAQVGVVNLQLSGIALFTAAHVGTRIRYINRQILITGVTGPYPSAAAVGLIKESLPGSQNLQFGVDPANSFGIGDTVRGTVTGSVGQVFSIDSPSKAMVVQLLNTNSTPAPQLSPFTPSIGAVAFTVADTVVGQGGGLQCTVVSVINLPTPSTIWDEEVMNAMRGWPASVFSDQFRLGFCDFPAVPNGIAWSAINSPTDLYIGDNPASAIFVVAPDKVRIYYVLAGPESSEFVFCDRKLYYIKIDASNPLKPGSVGFQILSGDGCGQVMPRITQDVILFANASRNSVIAIVAPGSYYRPFNTRNLTEHHDHLFNNIQCIAAPTTDGNFNERYAYVLNGDGSIAIGKYALNDGQVVPAIGWGPWSGVGVVKWIAAWASDVIFTASYFGATICELLDETRYLDCALTVNALPTAFAPPVGKGPLWWMPSQTVALMDQGTRYMGVYQIDGNGFIVPQNNGGENLALASLVAGQSLTSIVEPFCPNAQPGADVQQRMNLRYVARFSAAVIHSTGFMIAKLFSGRITPTSPPLGTPMSQRVFPAYNTGDDATKPPPSRETVESWRPSGGSYDPRIAIIKDTPGSMIIVELDFEVTL